MYINVSLSEVGMICQALQHKAMSYPSPSPQREEYAFLMGDICDDVKQYFMDTILDKNLASSFFETWENENHLIAPY